MPIFIRHHFLLETGRLQKLIPQVKSGTGLSQLHKKLLRIRFWATERGAWTMYVINVIPPVAILLIVTIILSPGVTIDRDPIFAFLNYILAFEIIVATVFVAWYTHNTPTDNYKIKEQVRVVMGLLISYVIISLMLNLFKIESDLTHAM